MTTFCALAQQKLKATEATRSLDSIDIHFNGFASFGDYEYDALIHLQKTISETRTAIDLGYNVDNSNHFVVLY